MNMQRNMLCLPKRFADLKCLAPEKIRSLWVCYIGTNAPPVLKQLWWKIQCEQSKQNLEQKFITRLNRYSKNPDKCIEHAQKNMYHIKPGTELLKKYRNQEYSVRVISSNEFLYADRVYKTLSAVAMKICGHKVSGYDFFGFNNKN